MNYFKYYCFFFFCILTGQTFAQKGYVLGKVLDSATGKGVNLATITNLKNRDMTRTNKEGVFFLDASVGDSIEIASLTHERGAFRWNGNADEIVFRLKKLDKAIEPVSYTHLDVYKRQPKACVDAGSRDSVWLGFDRF